MIRVGKAMLSRHASQFLALIASVSPDEEEELNGLYPIGEGQVSPSIGAPEGERAMPNVLCLPGDLE